MTSRLQRLRDKLDAHGVDAMLISQPESRYYLSGYTGHDLPPRDSAGYLLITKNKALLLTDARTTEQAERESPAFEVLGYGAGSRGPEAVAQTANKVGAPRLGFESLHLPYAIWQDIGGHLSGVQLQPVRDLIDELRIIKDPDELEHLQGAVDVLDRCLAHVLSQLQPGVTERQIARTIE